MKKKLFVLILLLTLSMIPAFTTTALTPIIPSSSETYPCMDPLPQLIPGNPDAYVTLQIDITDDTAAAAEAWITVGLVDTEETDDARLYVNGQGPTDLPLTGDGLTDTFDVDISVDWLVNGVNDFKFEYAGLVVTWGYIVNTLELTVKFGASSELIEWFADGYDPNYLTMNDAYPQNPEWLLLRTETDVHSTTTIILQGKDVYGQNIEAKVVIPKGTTESKYFVFNDTHTTPGQPVTFREITGILQQNGTHCNSFRIYTNPYPFEQYLGKYVLDGLDPTFNRGWDPNYLLPQGDDTTPVLQDVPVEPANPDPIKILINWEDDPAEGGDGDLFPDPGEFGPLSEAATIFIEGLDAYGNKMIVEVEVPVGVNEVTVNKPLGVETCCRTWSTICKVWDGAAGDEYYILTEPDVFPKRLFTYFIRIHHMTIHPDCYDILAYPDEIDTAYPGVTNITVALRDIDDNLVHWGDPNPANYIIVNFASTGGKIQPSNDVKINLCEITAQANLTADTNPRTVRVSASANVPPLKTCRAMNLFAWTEITFDGVNSVLHEGEILHAMQWGYESHYYNPTSGLWDTLFASYTGPVPPKPWLPPELGGPQPDGRKLDGPIYEVMIPLYVGCNLISVPVHPMLCSDYETGWGGLGIPMGLLFGKTSATDCIEAIWWYDGSWHSYIPSTGAGQDENFKDGVGYWIKAEKACTIEVSGVVMENAPFKPSEYPVKPSWNLMGFTSAVPLKTDDYLESLRIGDMKFYGPLWVYNAKSGIWTRNPDTLYPTQGFWMNYKDYDDFNNPVISP